MKTNLFTMHIFGTICFAYVQDKGKLDPPSEEGIFLGYDMYSPAYIIYLPKKVPIVTGLTLPSGSIVNL